MRNGGGGEFPSERECEGKKKSHSAGRKEPAVPKQNVEGFQKQTLQKATKRWKRALGGKAQKGWRGGYLGGSWELCAP